MMEKGAVVKLIWMVVALVVGSQLSVYELSGKMLLRQDLGQGLCQGLRSKASTERLRSRLEVKAWFKA